MKVRKVFGTETTDYLDGFQYTNSILKFFPTVEGYFNVETEKYVYNYTDHLGNTRLSYSKNGLGTEIIEENNYYPFGLKHEGYNTLLGNSSYQYKFQGQELQETGFYSFKWRNYMPDVGRFFNIDPLSEKYSYQSHYNFSENAVVAHRELEGLEKVFFQNVLFKDERFQKAYQAERKTTGGKEFSKAVSSQNKINVLYTNFSSTNATGIAPLIDNKKNFSEISKTFKIGVSVKEYDKISENGTKKNTTYRY
ncbi:MULTISPECIES: RHS repeat domain-containing protein [Chryseobacterium]|uniref:RHS repeat domain-containing protein n=1 Tax=Chryseobacterium TaxID=59732 RepID=UPI00083A79FF